MVLLVERESKDSIDAGLASNDGGAQDMRMARPLCNITPILTAIAGSIRPRSFNAALPYWHAAIAVLSLIAQYLLARKVLENWLIWIAVDILALGVYPAKGLYLTAGLYGVFLILASLG